ncbi:MAG: hypothetical protein D6696_10445 [Acidobacteria bacterium]|nr:MAG: hypothetical protein D6696_10445 [Acidobacteriota bacterium]
MGSEWRGLGGRLERRLIRAIDVVSILVVDAIILLFGYGLHWVIEKTTTTDSLLFSVARDISHGTFLLLYLVWVGWDFFDFLKGS